MNERAPLPEVKSQPTSGRVLVLSPHADDDVIGPGGTACLHAEAGDPVHVIIVYSGVAGDPEGRYEPQEYMELRRKEAQAAGAHLSLTSYEFWTYPEGHEPSEEQFLEAVQRLADRLRELRPDVVYSPWIGEQHLDHHVLARVARAALELVSFEGEAWGFEVWTPLIATLVVDITAQYDRKVAALREHASQITYVDIIHKALAVSAQRSIYVGASSRHAEGFAPLGAPCESDRALIERLRGRE